MTAINQKDLILYSGLIILGLAAPFLFSAFKVQLTYLCVLIVLAMTWNLQGGEMGYNSFGNILFYGLGMYLTASVQVGMFFSVSRMDRKWWRKNFCSHPISIFSRNGSWTCSCSSNTNNSCWFDSYLLVYGDLPDAQRLEWFNKSIR